MFSYVISRNMRASLLCPFLLLITSWPALGVPVITEIAALNGGEIEDKDGDWPAWVEFYNPGPDPVDLRGYYLTKDPDEPTGYMLPKFTIAAGQYRVLFLSGKDFFSLFQLDVHSNFTFDEEDAYIALIDPDGVSIVDSLEEIEHQRGTSFGREAPDTEATTLFRTPTPNEENRNPLLGTVKDTKFSVDRGFFSEPFEVEITTATEGATIIYSTSGRPPSEGSIFTGPIEHLYDGPIQITETTVLRAAAFKEGFAPSNIDTQTYLFTEDVVKQDALRTAITESEEYGPLLQEALTSIPSVSLAVDELDDITSGPSSRNDDEFLTSVEWLDPEGAEGFQVDAGVSRFGGYFTNFEKKSFRLYFRKRYGPGTLRYPLFRGFDHGVPAAETFDALNLRSGSHDMQARGAYLSNRFIDDTLLEMGNVAPHGRFVHVYFNGLYWGQYHLRERWNAAMMASYFGGSEDDYEAINGNNTGSEFLPGEAYDGSGDYWNEALQLARDDQPFQALRHRIDMSSYLCFQLTWMSGQSESEFQSGGSGTLNVPFRFYFKDADGYLRPPGNRLSNRGPGNFFQEWRTEADPDFMMLLADTIHKHYFNDGAFTPERNLARLQKRIEETKLSFLMESARWNYRTPTSWQNYQDNLLEEHFPDLTKDMIRAFERQGWYPDVTAPTLNQHGGAIEPGFMVQMNAGTLFQPQPGDFLYTLDGSDPRLPGGAINPEAETYVRKGAGVALDATTTLKVRTRDLAGEWSALAEATFHLGETPQPGDLIITEIHYRPNAVTDEEMTAGFTSRGDFEFLELYNRTDKTLSLHEVALVDGLRIDLSQLPRPQIAAQQVLLFVANEAAFRSRYGNTIPIAGTFDAGQLNNGGESLRLSRADGTVLFEMRYHDKEPWPEEADGDGKSLTLIDPTAVPIVDDPTAWAASTEIGGSPGVLGGGAPLSPSDESDQDGDGLPAFAEAALGSRDDDPSSGPDKVQIVWGAPLQVISQKASTAHANQFALESSPNLQEWELLNAIPTESLDGTQLTWEINESLSQRYVRLRITAP